MKIQAAHGEKLELIEISKDKTSYAVGDRAKFVVKSKHPPANSDLEYFLEVRLDGGEIKKIEKRGEVFRFSSPPLLLGSHNLMISVFIQDRRMASSLLEAISNLSKKLYDNSLKLESETDPETRGELMRENENLNSQISDMRIKLSGIRRLIGLKQMNNILVE